ncbi:MAG: hypothetical protein ACO3A4_10335 [Silvanigrellaceae bacterium]
MTVLSLALAFASNKKSNNARLSRTASVEKNIRALRRVGSTRFVMIEMGSQG